MPSLLPLDLPTARALTERPDPSGPAATLPAAVDELAVFSPEECRRIVALRDTLGFDQARVESREQTHEGPLRRDLSPEIRNTERTHVLHSRDHAWIYDRLAALVERINAATWDFRIHYMEPLQLLSYPVGGHYAWHTDLGARGLLALRKISVTVQLSPGEDYQGGDLEILHGGRVHIPPRPVGSAVLFPSWQPHRVTPVTGGVRRALVLWIVGKKSLR